MNSIAIYTRKSVSRDTNKEVSLQTQEDICRNYIQSHPEMANATVTVFQDEGISGKSLHREQVQDLMDKITNNEIDCVVVYKVDRLSRNVLDFYNIMDLMQKHACNFISVNENFDSKQPYGQLLMNMLISIAQMERQNIQIRERDSYYHRAKTEGRWLGGITPYGFKSGKTKDGKSTLIKVPEEMKVVHYCFNTYALDTESTLRGIARQLNDSTEFTCQNRTSNSVRSILKNPNYVKADKTIYSYYKSLGCQIANDESEFDGKHSAMIINKTDQSGEKYRSKEPSEWYVYITNFQGVVSSRIFLLCQERLSHNHNFSKSNSSKYKLQELSGFLRCCKCGASVKLTGKNNTSLMCRARAEQHICTASYKKIPLQSVQNAVGEQVQVYLNNVSERAETVLKREFEVNKEISQINQQIANLTTSLSNTSNILTQQTILKAIDDKNEQLNKLLLEKRFDMNDQDRIYAQVSRKFINSKTGGYCNYSDLTTEQKHALLKIICNRIVLFEDGHVKVEFKN